MKLEYLLLLLLALVALNCGGEKTPPQDPSTSAPPAPALGGDADAGAASAPTK